MAKKLPAIQFYPGDWRKDPGVQALDYESRGIWFEILLLMHESEERGKLMLNGQPMPEPALAQFLGIDVAKLQQTLSKLLIYGVASMDQTSGIIYNRRMMKDNELRNIRAESGRLGGKKTSSKRQANAEQNSTPSVSSSVSSSVSKQEKPLSGKKKKKPDQFALENFEALWSLYPEKVGKKEAQRHFTATVKTEADLELIKTALQNYIAKVESDRDAGRDRPWQNGSTFFNNWRDWLDYKPPQAKPETPDDGLSECLNCATRVPRGTLDGYSICETCINGGR